jgi:hypothetical protein
MRATELRLGNWVSAYGAEFQLKIQVNEILDIMADEITAIPLTEEWLINLGFVEMEDAVPEGYPSFRPPTGRARIYYSDSNGLYNWAVYQDLHIEDQIEIAHFQYVHQIQNLYFALTNEELRVKG